MKIGRTNRTPGERLDELWGATGVPTPFELVYDVLVPDAAVAETLLHAQLTAAGYRVSENANVLVAAPTEGRVWRAARIIDQLEPVAVRGPSDGPRGREVLVGLEELDQLCGPRR